MFTRQYSSRMKLLKINIVVFVLLYLSIPKHIMAQDLVYSQFYIAPMHFNSAFAGTVAYPSFTANYRLQWPGLTNIYESYSLGYDQYFPTKNLGAGLLINSDDQGNGTLKSTRAKAVISYNLRFNGDWQIKFGVGSSMVQNRLDWDRLVFFDQIDPVNGAVNTMGIPNVSSEVRPASLDNRYFDLDIGMLLYTPRFYAGFSMLHANGPYNGFLVEGTTGNKSSLPILLSFHGGYQVVINSDNKGNPTTFISPNILFSSQSGFNQVNIGGYLQKDQVFGGLWMRHTFSNIDAIIFSMGVNVGNLKIGYSYDITTSSLGLNTTSGSHEIGITMGLKHLEKKVSKLNDCLSLFR